MHRFVLILALALGLSHPLAAADEKALLASLLPLAQAGNAEAQYHVGMFYHNGLGTEKDPKQALSWFEKSTAGGDMLGAYKLGCYYDGQGEGAVATDHAKALEYKLSAANAGYALAQHDVAIHYASEGKFDEANRWWKMAGDQGFPMALYNLSSSYYAGRGIEKDLGLSYAYFKLSKLASERTVNSEAQTALDELAKSMSKEDLQKAKATVEIWKAQPTPLTLKALSGVEAAEALLAAKPAK